jgi:hypothetical protein
VRKLQLIHNASGGPLPGPLARIYRDSITPAAQADFSRCGRCGNDVDLHVWILRDPDDREQDGVIDCERRTA